MRSRSSGGRVIIGVLIAVLAIAVFGLVLHLIEKHGLIDEQFGDTGDWGEDSGIQYLTIGNEIYVTKDDIDVEVDGNTVYASIDVSLDSTIPSDLFKIKILLDDES